MRQCCNIPVTHQPFHQASSEWQSAHTDAAPLLLGYAHTGGSSSQQAPAATVLSELQQLLQRLQQSGYICGYQLVWGSLPGGWPGDWAVSEPQFVDADDVLQQPEPIAGGSVFQVGLLLPAVPFAVSSVVLLEAQEEVSISIQGVPAVSVAVSSAVVLEAQEEVSVCIQA